MMTTMMRCERFPPLSIMLVKNARTFARCYVVFAFRGCNVSFFHINHFLLCVVSSAECCDLILADSLEKVFNRPDIISQACADCGRSAQGGMALHIIVSRNKDGHGMAVIGQLSGPAQAEPGETAIEGPDRQVLPLNKAGANSVSAGIARLYLECDANKRSRRVTPARLHFAGRRGIVLLHHGVVEPVQKVMPDGIGICLPTVACDLHPARNPDRKSTR